MAKEYVDLGFTDDFMFCKVLTQHEDICKELAELILGKQIGRIIGLEDQKGIRITADSKGVRLDVYFTDDENNAYDLEMQMIGRANLPKRSRYYQGMVDLNIIEKGEDYEILKNTYIIFISPEDVFRRGRHIYTFENRCIEDLDFALDDGSRKVFICGGSAGCEDEVISPRLSAFLDYIAGKLTDDPFVERIDTAVRDAREHVEWRSEYMNILLRDQEKYKEGLREGRDNVLFQMLTNGMSPEDISRYTSVPLKDVLEAREKHHIGMSSLIESDDADNNYY